MDDLANPPELPAMGYPPSEAALTDWFRRTRGREPTELEIGRIVAAMARRDATPPHDGPHSDPQGWRVDPVAPPATRR